MYSAVEGIKVETNEKSGVNIIFAIKPIILKINLKIAVIITKTLQQFYYLR